MSETTCPTYTWCDIDDDPTFHRKIIGHGIEFCHDEEQQRTYVDWMPDWTEWTIEAGQVRQEIADLVATLITLPSQFQQFQQQVRSLVRATEPGTPDIDGRGGGL